MTNFEEYIKQTEPDKREKGLIWQVAIGLQQVDGLTPSAYLIEIAKQNIEGDITIDEVKSRINSYYKTAAVRVDDADRTEEADKVSANITDILSEKTFSFSPVEYIGIHRRLFSGIYKFAGKIRDYNITKQEWVLGGETVFYSSAPLIRETLEYDFREEKNFSYKGLSQQEQVEHITKFISGLWQIHPFGEGNTRTTAVFAIKYLRTFGFKVENEPFAEHSWYFRNALVRANYNDSAKGILATPKYLNRFFGNLLFGETHALKNRELHIDFKAHVRDSEKLGVNKDTPNMLGVSDGEKLGVKLNKNQLRILELIIFNDKTTMAEMAQSLSISVTAVENNIRKLKERGIISRVGSDKTGHWLVGNQ
ncbi:MAG: Fic family protein [Alistipes sp.]|jgi:fido (protein-threonine AMPylation protein)/biotin operon repressor|nr:Fic family protein [Alistipes sp.]